MGSPQYQLEPSHDEGGVGLATVAGDGFDFRVRPEPVNDLLPIAGVEDGKHLTGIVVDNDTHVLMPFPLGEVVQADEAAGAHLRIYPAYLTQCPDAGRGAYPYMLHRQRLGCLPGRLAESLMTDTLLHFMSMTSVGAGHHQRLSKYLPLTPGVCAYHVAGLQDQRGMMAKPLRTLNLAKAVSVDRRSALAAAGADGRTSNGMTVEG